MWDTAKFRRPFYQSIYAKLENKQKFKAWIESKSAKWANPVEEIIKISICPAN